MSEYNEEKDKRIIKEILSLEKVNNRSQHYTNQEMVNKIITIIRKEINDEI